MDYIARALVILEILGFICEIVIWGNYGKESN